jgi:UDP-GlcNAc:undecaprenyl-phosphate/decaprenyl-phosphate GlcNAc-1-phosphate transferase
LGFLRYNFHPASIFLGDSGSYTLGYALAGLSVLAARKSEAAVAILTPVVALGVPMIDAAFAPVRRFILGRGPFRPDRDHIHHRLLKLGYTHQRAVMVLYAATIAMGLVALALVHARDDRAALILVLVGATAIVLMRQLGYLEFVKSKRVVGWLGNLSDDLGLRQARRSFFECQVSIAEARTAEDLWQAIVVAVRFIGVDHCELILDAFRPANLDAEASRSYELRYSQAEDSSPSSLDPAATFMVSLPLRHGASGRGRLVVWRQTAKGVDMPYLLRRLDQLHWAVNEALGEIAPAISSKDAPIDGTASNATAQRLSHAELSENSAGTELAEAS